LSLFEKLKIMSHKKNIPNVYLINIKITLIFLRSRIKNSL